MNEKGSILIVDHNETLVTTISMILNRKGYQVETAFNGQEAIDLTKTRPFNLIFLDLKMPGMNGLDVMKHIRKIRPKANILIMTAYGSQEYNTEAIDAGAIHVLHKPFNMVEVLSLIDEIISSDHHS